MLLDPASSIPPLPPIPIFQPFAPLLQLIAPPNLATARAKVGGFERTELLTRFSSAFHEGKRLPSLLYADGLTALGIPPAFWHSHLSRCDITVEQRFDLFAYDVRWLRSAYPDHTLAVRYERIKHMLTGSENTFWRAAEYAFYGGRRPAWKLVGSLSLERTQQMDCWWLRSAPVTRSLKAVTEIRDQVLLALSEDLKGVRRTRQFSDAHAAESLLRRHRLWQCAQMADGKPVETARRYLQMTGESLSRQAVANQLQKVDAALRRSAMTSA